MPELDRRVALLRLFLADVTDRERRVRDEQAQIRGQIERVVDFTVRFNGGVVNALASLAEVEERAAGLDRTLKHLGLLRQRARAELEALLVTRGVADARERLVELEARREEIAHAQKSGAEPAIAEELAAIESEIADLRAQIQSASEAAARALAQGQ